MAQGITLTEKQKLHALAFRFYQGGTWTPKANDYYTTSRSDLELYQVVEVTEHKIKTRYCDTSKSTEVSEWDRETFLTEGFGINRVWVPNWVLTLASDSPSPAIGDLWVKVPVATPPETEGTYNTFIEYDGKQKWVTNRYRNGEWEQVLTEKILAYLRPATADDLKEIRADAWDAAISYTQKDSTTNHPDRETYLNSL